MKILDGLRNGSAGFESEFIQGVSRSMGQTLRGDRSHQENQFLSRNSCPSMHF